MAITAADVKKLRELTGAGMMDCKKALEEADGDFDKADRAAPHQARQEGRRSAVPSAGRVLGPGRHRRWRAGRAELRDRLRRQERRLRRAPPSRSPTPPTRPRPADAEALKAVQLGGKTVGEVVEALAVTHRREDRARPGRRTSTARSWSYMHRRAADLPPAVGVLVEYDGSDEEAARGAAMQIAAMRPQYVTRDEVPADVVEKERSIAEATAREEGKPEQALAQDRRGPAQRLLQGGRPARPAVGRRTARRRSRPCSTRPASRSSGSPASRSEPDPPRSSRLSADIHRGGRFDARTQQHRTGLRS